MFLASEMFWWGVDRDYDAKRLQILLTIQSHSYECANKGRQAENDECALSGLQGEMHGFRLVRQRTELEVISNGIWHGKQSHARILYNRVTEPWSFLFWAQYGEKDKISFYFAIGTGMLNIFFFEPIGLGSFSWTPGMAELAVSLIPFPLVKE